MASVAEQDHKKLNEEAGSLSFSEPAFICVGKIHRSHGIHGEIVLAPMTDFPERFRRGRKVYAGEDHRPLEIQQVRQQAPYFLVSFTSIQDEQQAAELRNSFLYVRKDELPKLPKGEYYFHEVIGLQAVTKDGKAVGTVSEILETGANNVYVIKKEDNSEELVPAVPQYILEIKLDKKQIVINFPEWA